MSDLQYNLHEVIGKYVSGTLTQDEAEFLDRQIELDPSIGSLVRKNIMADFWLARKFAIDLEIQRESSQVKNESPEASFLNCEAFFAEMVQYEKNAKPIHDDVSPQPAKTSWIQKWFAPQTKASQPNETQKAAPVSAKSRRRSNFFFGVRLFLFVSFISWLCYDGNRKPTEYMPVTFNPQGRITEMVDVVWGENSPTYKRGQFLGAERFSLKKGLIKIVLGSGAELILESPGTYTLSNTMRFACEQGKINAHIPRKACGFEIISPHGRFIDRGTDFYIDTQSDKTDMGVVLGQVDYVQKDGTFQALHKGREIRVMNSVPPVVSRCSETRYFDMKRFLPILEDYFTRRNQEKTAKAIQWDSRPNLLVRLDMNRKGTGPIPNSSVRGRNFISSATPQNISTETGMTPSTRAWNFKEGSSVQLNIPGQYKSFSLMANIQINRLPNMGNVLFSSENITTVQGAIVWQITRDGILQLQISKGKNTVNYVYDSPVCLTPKTWGTWVNIAVVIDDQRKRIRHYVDGKMISSTPWKQPTSIIPGNGLIGNASHQQTNNKYYLGCPMTDFMIFDYPMTENDFQEYLIDP